MQDAQEYMLGRYELIPEFLQHRSGRSKALFASRERF